MFCQRDEVYKRPSNSMVTVHLLRKSSDQGHMLRKNRLFNSYPRALQVDCNLINQISEEAASVSVADSHDDKNDVLKAQRYQLEKDVFNLQKQLQQEVDLHHVLENAFGHAAGAFPKFWQDLPADAQELLQDVAMLEAAISNLEEQIVALNLELDYEQNEREKTEHRFLNLSSQVQDEGTHIGPQPSIYLDKTEQPKEFPTSTLGRSCVLPSNAFCTKQHAFCVFPMVSTELSSPEPCDHFPSSYCDNSVTDTPAVCTTSPRQQILPQNVYSDDDCGSQFGCAVRSQKNGREISWQKPYFYYKEKVRKHSVPPSSLCGEIAGRMNNFDIREHWQQPNRLSEEMVNCMISIYRHLADPADALLSSSANLWPPKSPCGHINSHSFSSFSESSISLRRPVAADLQNDQSGAESSFDPYRTQEKLPWADIGSYSKAIEVSEMCVGKEQLEYAAEALRMFRSLVEHLSRVDPSSMLHDEKLAFWINVYNALMMHAYLAYGTPKNDFKFFSLMQKAAYTVGGHSFNAVIIEHLLLRSKSPGYRSQISLLLAHQKMKLTEEVRLFAIDRLEPLVTFALSFGARSSPAVRVYTAGNVHEELHAALQDYIRAAVGISARGKLLVPKLLHDFGQGLVEQSALLNWICHFLLSGQASIVKNSQKHWHCGPLNSKHLVVVPFDFRFRYLFLLRNSQHTVCPQF